MGWQILIVDDEHVFAQTLALALTRRGHAAIIAGNSATAMAQAAAQSFDAVVLDLRIGTESGLHLIEPLRSQQPNIKIVLLTGYASIATAVSAIKLGAVQYLPKPAGVDDILAALGYGKGQGIKGQSEGNEMGRQHYAVSVADVALPAAPLSVGRLEWEYIQTILAQHEGNLSATARALKMHRRTLQRKLAKRPLKD
jgi:two-component system response regulator RegA